MKAGLEGLKAALYLLIVGVPAVLLLIYLPGYYLESKMDLEGEIVTLTSGEDFEITKMEPVCILLYCITEVEAKTRVWLPDGPRYDFTYRGDEVLKVLADGEQIWSRETNSEPFYEWLKAEVSTPLPLIHNGWSVKITTTFEIK